MLRWDVLIGWLTGVLLLAAVGLFVVGGVRAPRRRRVTALVAALVVVATGLVGIEQSYRHAPAPARALGVVPAVRGGSTAGGNAPATSGAGSGGGTSGPTPAGGTERARPRPSSDPATPSSHGAARAPSAGRISAAAEHALPAGRTRPISALATWRPRGHLPTKGAVSEVRIPGTVSGFTARPGWVYLPPAYLTSNRPDLPLLILLPGEPGGPENWINNGHLARTMDAFAAQHHGLAPVVVVPDLTGAHRANTMCVDSALGNAGTYFRQDVIHWILANLHVDRDTAHWAIGGFSFGGTCSLQYAVDYPRLFPTFLDISGEEAPTLGSARESITEAFGGDAAAYRAIQPLRKLAAASTEPTMAALWRTLDGTFVVGTQDPTYGRQQAVVVQACRRAGMAVHATTYPGRHLWVDAYVALVQALPHLAARMGLPS